MQIRNIKFNVKTETSSCAIHYFLNYCTCQFEALSIMFTRAPTESHAEELVL